LKEIFGEATESNEWPSAPGENVRLGSVFRNEVASLRDDLRITHVPGRF
jgi:hypothetical protein